MQLCMYPLLIFKGQISDSLSLKQVSKSRCEQKANEKLDRNNTNINHSQAIDEYTGFFVMPKS